MSDTLSISLTPGYLLQDGEVLDPAKLRAIARPTVQLIGTIGASTIADGSVTTPKLADGVLSADATGRGKMADLFVTVNKLVDSILSADATGRAKMADGYVTAAKLEETARENVMQYAAGVFAANVYGVTLVPAATAYTEGMVVRFKADTANAGSASVNVNGLGAKTLRFRGASLVLGDILANQIVECVYNGTQFDMTGTRSYLPAEGVVAAMNGLVVQRASNSTVSVAGAELVLKETSTGRTVLASAFFLSGDITVVGANGRDSATSEAASTWYYIYVISDGSTTATLFSTSSTTPTLPANYRFFALAGAVYNDAGLNFVVFYQVNRKVWINESVVFTGQAGVVSYQLQTLSPLVPPIANRAFGTAGCSSNVNKGIAVAADANGLGACTVSAAGAGAGATNSFFMAGHWDVPLKTTQQVFWLAQDTAANYRMTVSGYEI